MEKFCFAVTLCLLLTYLLVKALSIPQRFVVPVLYRFKEQPNVIGVAFVFNTLALTKGLYTCNPLLKFFEVIHVKRERKRKRRDRDREISRERYR